MCPMAWGNNTPNEGTDLTPLLRALADAEAALSRDSARRLAPELRAKYDRLRDDLIHIRMRANALRSAADQGPRIG